MAYASVVSVVQILEQLLHSDSFPVHYPKPETESLHKNVLSLQSSFEKLFPVPKSSRSAVNDLEIKIRNAMYDVLDTVEYFICNQIPTSDSEEIPEDKSSMSAFVQGLKRIIKNVDAMAESAEEIAGSMRHTREDQQTGDSVASVVQILEQLLHSDSFPAHYPKPEIESLHENVLSLQSSFKKLFPVPKSLRSAVNDLEIQIRYAMSDVQDTIEYFNQIPTSDSQEIPEDKSSMSSFLQGLQKIITNVNAMAKLAEEMAAYQRRPANRRFGST